MLPFRLFSKEGIKPVSTEAWSFQYLLQKLKKTLWFPWVNRLFLPLLLTPDIDKTRAIYPAHVLLGSKCVTRDSSRVMYLELS